jgi:hypothetical protein
VVAEPAQFPGGRQARPVIAALYGDLQLHAPRGPQADSPDLYGLFLARSSAMGWLTESVEGARGGLWGMNEAEHDPSSSTRPHKIAWCQVSLTNPDPAGRAPLQPLVACLGDAVARIGRPRVSAIQIALPASEPRRSSSTSALDALIGNDSYWFLNGGQQPPTGIRMTLDGGRDSAMHLAIMSMVQWMLGAQHVVSLDSVLLQDDCLDPPVRNFEGDTWPGPPHHRATIGGTLEEWSLDALGWFATLVTAAASNHGVGSPWMLTVSKVDELSDDAPREARPIARPG